jgi:hypothetical protein
VSDTRGHVMGQMHGRTGNLRGIVWGRGLRVAGGLVQRLPVKPGQADDREGDDGWGDTMHCGGIHTDHPRRPTRGV